MDTTVKLDLMETGTRYQYYTELRDAFATGIEILKRGQDYHDNKTSQQQIRKLEHAVELIESRVNYLADYMSKSASHSEFGKLLRSIPPHRTLLLTGGSDAKDGDTQDSKPSEDPST